jgi:hypothetical protein
LQQLVGPCDEKFNETIEEMTELFKKTMEMIERDEAHIKQCGMQELMHFSEGMNAWYENKEKHSTV